jgi:hypothetical protein
MERVVADLVAGAHRVDLAPGHPDGAAPDFGVRGRSRFRAVGAGVFRSQMSDEFLTDGFGAPRLIVREPTADSEPKN